MAIKYYTGVPRSGKTYKAMTVLYYTFVNTELSFFDKLLIKYKLKKEKEIEFDYAYTNINQFNFEISDKIFHLDFTLLYSYLKILHNMSILKASDYELIEKAKELNIYKTLFVIDECHNFLKAKDDSTLVWWFTYHAHLHHELILITQDLSLVNTEYKRVAEYFYKAIPSRFRMSKNTFKYIQYSTAGMYEKDKIGVDTVKANKKIFSLYVSGSDSNGKSIIHKYIIMAVIALFSCFVFIYYLMASINPNEQETINEETQINNLESSQNLSSNENQSNLVTPAAAPEQTQDNLKLFKFNCFKTFCYYQFQNKTTLEIPQKILTQYLKDINEDNKYFELKENRLSIYVLVEETKFNFIKERGNENEKNTNTNQSISLLGSASK